MNDPGTDSIRKNLVLDTLAKTLTIDQEQSEPDKGQMMIYGRPSSWRM